MQTPYTTVKTAVKKRQLSQDNLLLYFVLFLVAALAILAPKNAFAAKAKGRSTATLASVNKAAQKQNIDLQILRKRLQLAELARSKAWSGFRPVFGINGTYTRNPEEVKFGQNVITPINQLNLNLQLNWTFLNFQLIPQIQMAGLNKEQVRYVNLQTQRELYYSIVRGYYNVLMAQGSVDIAKKTWDYAQSNLKIAKVRRQAGVSTALFVSQAKLDAAKAKQNWQAAQNSLAQSQLALALLTGQMQFKKGVVRPKAPGLPFGSIQNWLNQAQRTRAEIKAGRLGIQIAQKQKQQVWAQYLPTVGMNGNLRLANAEGLAGQRTQWSVGLNLQWNIYNGGSRVVAIRESHTNYRKARLELRKTQQKVGNEVRTAYINYQNAKRSVALAKNNVNLARQTYQLQQKRMRAGMSTPLAVSNAMNQLFSAEISYLREQLNQDLSVYGIQRAVGAFKPNFSNQKS